MNCAECDEPISKETIYFWGKDGGEWHPACLRKMERKGSFARGMWMNTHEPFQAPDEYLHT